MKILDYLIEAHQLPKMINPKLLDIEWMSTLGLRYSAREDGYVECMVSDHSKAKTSNTTNKKIVYVCKITGELSDEYTANITDESGKKRKKTYPAGYKFTKDNPLIVSKNDACYISNGLAQSVASVEKKIKLKIKEAEAEIEWFDEEIKQIQEIKNKDESVIDKKIEEIKNTTSMISLKRKNDKFVILKLKNTEKNEYSYSFWDDSDKRRPAKITKNEYIEYIFNKAGFTVMDEIEK